MSTTSITTIINVTDVTRVLTFESRKSPRCNVRDTRAEADGSYWEWREILHAAKKIMQI